MLRLFKEFVMIYTSYFAKVNKLPDNIVPISISAKPPRGYKGLQYKKLAPTYQILMDWKETGDTETYIEEYDDNVLSNFKPVKIVTELIQMSEGKDIALICFEKPDDFCHRHLVAEWLTNAGFECSEYIF